MSLVGVCSILRPTEIWNFSHICLYSLLCFLDFVGLWRQLRDQWPDLKYLTRNVPFAYKKQIYSQRYLPHPSTARKVLSSWWKTRRLKAKRKRMKIDCYLSRASQGHVPTRKRASRLRGIVVMFRRLVLMKYIMLQHSDLSLVYLLTT